MASGNPYGPYTVDEFRLYEVCFFKKNTLFSLWRQKVSVDISITLSFQLTFLWSSRETLAEKNGKKEENVVE
jgi:hypothetical protein